MGGREEAVEIGSVSLAKGFHRGRTRGLGEGNINGECASGFGGRGEGIARRSWMVSHGLYQEWD